MTVEEVLAMLEDFEDATRDCCLSWQTWDKGREAERVALRERLVRAIEDLGKADA